MLGNIFGQLGSALMQQNASSQYQAAQQQALNSAAQQQALNSAAQQQALNSEAFYIDLIKIQEEKDLRETNPAVKEAWERYQMVLALARKK